MQPRPGLHALLNFGPIEPLAKHIALVACLGMKLRVMGRKRVPAAGPLVVVSGHPGPADLPTLDATLGRPLDIVLDDALLSIPILGRLFRVRGAHPLRQAALLGDEANAGSLAGAAAAARAGRAVVIFPEGAGGFGSGAARIAADAQAPVLPVAIYRVGGDGAPLRRLVVIGRPIPAPERDARSRRAFMERLRRRQPDPRSREALAMALDDPRIRRRPAAIVRRAARLARLDGAARRKFLRAADALRRGCAALRCSVGDLREPPGLRDVAAYLALLAPAAMGLVLCAPTFLALRLVFARLGRQQRFARFHVGIALALPYGIALAAAGLALGGLPGLLLPFAALLGLCCSGAVRPLHRRLAHLPRVRRHGPRLRRRLEAFDRAIYADRVSAPFFSRVA